MAHLWDRGVLNTSSWHGLEEVGVFVDAASQIVHGEKSGAWPVSLRTAGLATACGLTAPVSAQVASYLAHPERIVGVNGDRYRATACEEWRSLVNAACEAGAKPTGAFSLCDGTRALATFEIGESNGIRTQFLLVDSFDGSLKLATGFTSIRVVCANTLAMSLGQDGKNMAQLRHTASLETKVKILAESIGDAIKNGGKVKETFAKASNVTLAREKAIQAFDALFPEADKDASKAAKTRAENTRHEARIAATLPINKVGSTGGNLGTLWNAATYLVDRTSDGKARASKGDDMNSLLFGSRAERLFEIQEIVESALNDGTIVQSTMPRAVTIDDLL